jgi:hypothetical protein
LLAWNLTLLPVFSDILSTRVPRILVFASSYLPVGKQRRLAGSIYQTQKGGFSDAKYTQHGTNYSRANELHPLASFCDFSFYALAPL